MTIKENAKHNADVMVGYNDTLHSGFEAGYTIGAKDYIHKAVEWLKEHPYAFTLPNGEANFHKYMEE